jgi:RNA polymerase sigma factor (sigma-70 family)
MPTLLASDTVEALHLRTPNFAYQPSDPPVKKRGTLHTEERVYTDRLIPMMIGAWRASGLNIPQMDEEEVLSMAAESLTRSKESRLARLVAWGMLLPEDARHIFTLSPAVDATHLARMLWWFIAEHQELGGQSPTQISKLIRKLIPQSYVRYLFDRFHKEGLSYSDASYFAMNYADPVTAIHNAFAETQRLTEKYAAHGVTAFDAWRFIIAHSDADTILKTALDEADRLTGVFHAEGLSRSEIWYFVAHHPVAKAEANIRNALSKTKKLQALFPDTASGILWHYAKGNAKPEAKVQAAHTTALSLRTQYEGQGVSIADAWHFTMHHKNPEAALKATLCEADRLAKHYDVSKGIAWFCVTNYSNPEEAVKKGLGNAATLSETFAEQGMTPARARRLAFSKPANPQERTQHILGETARLARQYRQHKITKADAKRFAQDYANPEQALQNAIKQRNALAKKYKLSRAVAWFFVTAHKGPETAIQATLREAERLAPLLTDAGIRQSDIFFVARTSSNPEAKLRKALSAVTALIEAHGEDGVTGSIAWHFALHYEKPNNALKKALGAVENLMREQKISNALAWYIAVHFPGNPMKGFERVQARSNRLMDLFGPQGLNKGEALRIALSSGKPVRTARLFLEKTDKLLEQFAGSGVSRYVAKHFAKTYTHATRALRKALETRDVLHDEFRAQGLTRKHALFFAALYPTEPRKTVRGIIASASALYDALSGRGITRADAFFIAARHPNQQNLTERAGMVLDARDRIAAEFSAQGITPRLAYHLAVVHAHPHAATIAAVEMSRRLISSFGLNRWSALEFAVFYSDPESVLNELQQGTASIAEIKRTPSQDVWNRVTDHLDLIKKEIAKYYGGRLSPDDLFQEGILGLLRAAELYDPERGATFPTYAVYHIRNALQNAASDQRNVIRQKRNVRELQRKISKGAQTLRNKQHREPTAEEIAAEIGIVEEKVRDAFTMASTVISLDKPVGDSTTELGAFVADAFAVDPEETLIEHDASQKLSEQLEAALHQLNPQQAFIIRKRFGLDGEEALTLEEIARQMDPPLSRERIRQVEAKAKQRMRKLLPDMHWALEE